MLCCLPQASKTVITAGLEFTRRQIVAVVHIGEATLAKRVSEFATTAAGALTLTEFDTRCRELEEEQQALLESPPAQTETEIDPDYCCIHVGKQF